MQSESFSNLLYDVSAGSALASCSRTLTLKKMDVGGHSGRAGDQTGDLPVTDSLSTSGKPATSLPPALQKKAEVTLRAEIRIFRLKRHHSSLRI